LAAFFIALAVPTAVLIRQAYTQLKWEAFHQHRVLAEELALRIDARLTRLVNTEESRSFSDYAFLVLAGDPAANFLQRSPLSAFPVQSEIPGLVGYFQVDAAGVLSTPIMPRGGEPTTAYGISPEEFAQRQSLQARIQDILSRNRLVSTRPDALNKRSAVPGLSPPRGTRPSIETDEFFESRDTDATAEAKDAVSGQAAFDKLNQARSPAPLRESEIQSALGKVEDLKLDSTYERKQKPAETRARQAAPEQKRYGRKERSSLPEPQTLPKAEAGPGQVLQSAPIRVSTFESEIDPFDFSRLDSGHFVLFRKVWREGQRYIQGALIEQADWLHGVFDAAFRNAALASMSDLVVAYRGDVLSAFTGRETRETLASADELSGALLYRTRLSAPLGDVELIFSISHLPAGPNGALVTWLAGTLIIVLCGGFYLMYRLGAQQIDVARQQQDFISAVSHELKTPLTSIRMYGEMLREGWVTEDKKRGYYDYIYTESERLSRLINNVLQLARMTRRELSVDRKRISVAELMDGVRSKISSQVEQAGYALSWHCDAETSAIVVAVDTDGFTQILINLVDNAIKFSAKSARKAIEIGCRRDTDGAVIFSVRDYGPGLPKEQMRKIFRLFYRLENELTRETVGTGIGLALVQQLVRAMGARIDVVNREPGAEFRVRISPG
jgi:signal transduction histidine kinase